MCSPISHPLFGSRKGGAGCMLQYSAVESTSSVQNIQADYFVLYSFSCKIIVHIIKQVIQSPVLQSFKLAFPFPQVSSRS